MSNHISREDLPNIRISRHAREVMARRQVSEVEVGRTLVYGSSHPHNGLMRYVREGLCVVYAPDDMVVVTVLLFRQDTWTDEDARRR